MHRLLLLVCCAQARMFCEKTKLPLEVGTWTHHMEHMDSAVVENRPVSISEGQVYVYENNFPGYIIKYIHVDNVAIKTCGASASIKNGGVGTSTVLVVLHADSNQEIRSVVDVWGVRDLNYFERQKQKKFNGQLPKDVKSLYLSGKVRAINHNLKSLGNVQKG